jgi:D-tyrosyl-tRNA(Tyr) deacylase
MRLLIQRVSRAEVRIESQVVGKIGQGLLVLQGVGKDDSAVVAQKIAQKVSKLRIFQDDEGKMNNDIKQSRGEVLVVSQFTLYGNTKKGNRPSFVEAAEPGKAEELYLKFVKALKEEGLKVETGEFGAMMKVELVNDGPVTIWLED